jgi:hypothetical protein
MTHSKNTEINDDIYHDIYHEIISTILRDPKLAPAAIAHGLVALHGRNIIKPVYKDLRDKKFLESIYETLAKQGLDFLETPQRTKITCERLTQKQRDVTARIIAGDRDYALVLAHHLGEQKMSSTLAYLTDHAMISPKLAAMIEPEATDVDEPAAPEIVIIEPSFVIQYEFTGMFDIEDSALLFEIA